MLWYSYERVCLCEYKHLVIKNAYKYFSTHHFTMFHVFALSLLSASCALFVSSFAIIQSSCMLCIFFFNFPFRFEPTSMNVASWEVVHSHLPAPPSTPPQSAYTASRYISLIGTIYLVLAFGSALDCNDLDKVCLLSKFEHKYCANSCRCLLSPVFPFSSLPASDEFVDTH